MEVDVGEYVKSLMEEVIAKNPSEPEFHQAVEEVAESIAIVLERHPEYRKAKIGTVQLKAARHQAVFQSVGKPRNFLFDLREISLVPADDPPTK